MPIDIKLHHMAVAQLYGCMGYIIYYSDTHDVWVKVDSDKNRSVYQLFSIIRMDSPLPGELYSECFNNLNDMEQGYPTILRSLKRLGLIRGS